MKKRIIWMLAAAMLLTMAACGRRNITSEAEPGVLRLAVPFDMETMDVAQTTRDYMVPLNVFDRLLEIETGTGGSFQVVPSLCTEYTVSPDGLTYSFTLREGVCFSNGSDLTASDVHYSFARLLQTAAVNYDVAAEIRGAEAVLEGKSSRLEGFQEQDDLHFTVTLSKPNAGFPAELTGPGMSIVDRETTEKTEKFGTSCEDTVGTGPYRITQWVEDDHYILEYNEHYWGKKPSVEKVIVTVVPDESTRSLMFQSGAVDILDLETLDAVVVSSTYKDKYKTHLLSSSRVGITYLALNHQNPFLKDVRVRQAIRKAVDVETIIAAVYQGDAIRENGVIPKGIWGHNDNLRPPVWNPEDARHMLEEAGYEEGEIHLELAMESSASSSMQVIYQMVEQQLEAVGIDVLLATYDASSWLEVRKSGKMDAYISTWTMDYNDPANVMVTFFGSPENGRLRSINYQNEEVMDRITAASGIMDGEERLNEYQKLERILIEEDAAWVPLLGNTHLFAKGSRVSSFTPYWTGYSDFCVKTVVLE